MGGAAVLCPYLVEPVLRVVRVAVVVAAAGFLPFLCEPVADWH